MKYLPLSEYQKSFWLDWKLNPTSSKYNTPLIYEIRGNLNLEILEKALSLYMNEYHQGGRHYCLEEKGEVYQAALEFLLVKLEIEENESVDGFIEKQCNYFFDLTKPPLFKFTILKVQPNHFILILNFHHIITDALTAHVIVSTVSALYNHYAYGLALPPKPTHFFEDYLLYEKKNYTQPDKEKDLLFWQEKLKDKNVHLQFMSSSSLEQEDLSQSTFFSLNEELTNQLKALARKEGTTVFIVLTALYAILLSRYTHQKQIPLSYSVNVRPGGFKKITGCFINNVPCIVELGDNLSFRELIQQLTTDRKQLRSHQRCSFTDILSLLKQNKQGKDMPFNVSIMETYLNIKPLSFLGLETNCIKPIKKYTFNDLCLHYEVRNKIEFRLDYKISLFDAYFIEQFPGHFEVILKHCLLNTHANVNHFSVLTERELQKIQAWNITQEDFNQNKTVCDLFEEQVIQTPNNIALIFEGKSLTYDALNRKANQLARFLMSLQGNQPKIQNPIAICMDKKIELVVAILGILKAGAAYIPVDPADAPYRIQAILEEADISIVLTLKNNFKKLPILNNCKQVIQLDSEWSKIKMYDENNTHNNPNSQDLINVIYTSGSTGKPKGVLIEHKSVLNVVLDIKNKLKQDNMKVLSLSSPSFDIYGLELFLPLICGGTHILCTKEVVRDPKKIVNIIETTFPTLIQATPTLWGLLIPNLKSLKLTKSITFFSGGETLNKELALQLKELSHSIWNLYGPTETTIWSTYHILENDGVPWIGKALANTKLHILDEFLNEVPIGVVGELYISGLGLARGYLKDEALTKKRFVNNYYKTNDYVRRGEFGQLEYIGRQDSQVKIRGFRIELGEVESKLMSHPKINTCLVILQEYQGHPHIVAYYSLKNKTKSFMQKVFNNTADIKNSQLHQYLKKRLPKHMLPAAYIKILEIPTTINGKIDKTQLLPLSSEHFLMEDEKVPVSDIMELKLKELWQTVLNINDLGVGHDFFEVGGHSVLAVSLVLKINEVFKKQYPVVWVFEHKTIASQAKALRQEKIEHFYQPIIKFNHLNQNTPFSLFLVHPGLTGAEVYDELSRNLGDTISCYAFDSYNLNSGEPFLGSVEALAKTYIVHLKSVKPKGPYRLGGWSFGGIIAYEMSRQLTNMGDTVEKLYLFDTQLYMPDYIQYLHDAVSVKGLICELPENRGQYLASLPEPYLEKVLLSLKNDMLLLKNYTVKPYQGPVLLIKSLIKTRLNRGLLNQKHNGWKPFIQNLNIQSILANHYNLLEGKNAQLIATLLREDISI